MENILKYVGVVALIIAIIGVYSPVAKEVAQLGGLTNFDEVGTTDGYEVDNSQVIDGNGDLVLGTTINAIRTGSCTIWAPATTITATSTQQVECQSATGGDISTITGVTADSICDLNMASSTNTTIGSLAIGGVSASSTAGTIVARLINLTGTTFTWTAVASSSPKWNYMCIDPT